MRRVVIDTNVIIAAMRSQRGASNILMRLIGTKKFEVAISVPLALEYETVAKRLIGYAGYTEQDIDALIDYLCQVAIQTQVYFLWRPFLTDSADDMVLEAAVAAGCESIITFNGSDFYGIDRFGLHVQTPAQFLREIGELE
jgi:putative PIN family toxin of toxin-antitoxin system